MSKPAPLRHVVVIGHPAPESFNHALAQTYIDTARENFHEVDVNDLYARDFDPRLPADERPGPHFHLTLEIAAELELVRKADAIVLVYPIWFGMPPAIIKGYVDRVLGAGFRSGDIRADAANPMTEGKQLILISTSATTRPWLEERGQWLALRRVFDTYLTDIFGFKACEHIHFDAIVPEMSINVGNQHRASLREKTRRICADLSLQRHSAAHATLRLAKQ